MYANAGRVSMRDSFAKVPAKVVGKPKRIANNTFQYTREDGATVYRLRQTDIIVERQDGRIELYSGGWRTVTTKARLNELLKGYSIYSVKGMWVVSNREVRVPFYEGMILPDAMNEVPSKKDEARIKAERKLLKQINDFVKLVDKKDPKTLIPEKGDCWYCLMHTQDGKSLGEVTDSDHLLSHIRDGYLHGSLIVNACRAYGWSDDHLRYWFSGFIGRDRVKNPLRRYLKHMLKVGAD